MGIRKALLPLIPIPLLNIYYKIKRFLIFRKQIFGKTGNNYVTREEIQLNELLLNNQVDSIKIIRYLDWENPFNVSEYGKYQYQEKEFKIINEKKVIVEFNNYGSWTVEIYYLRKGRTIAKEVKTINIEAPEYNIAYLSATLPVVFFLFNMWKISNKNCPTIVSLERNLFDYYNLPKNVYPFPYANKNELNTPYKGFNVCFQRLVYYIGSLYRMNRNAKFNLYLCDHFAYLVLSLLYANGIPEENFHVYLLSDGVGSYECFNYVFKNEKAIEIYEKMKNTWEISKKLAYKTGVQKRKKEIFLRCGSPCMSETIDSRNETIKFSYGFSFAYVLAIENANIEWILHDPRLLKGNEKVLSLLDENRIRRFDFIDSIKILEDHKDELIKLLNIDYSVFAESTLIKKQICILLGTDLFSSDFEKYIDSTINHFGINFDYYLKEHPRYPINLQRSQRLADKGVKILNPKIPTEFYMMIDSNICLAGYLSSVFLSKGLLRNPEEQILSIWDVENREIKTNCLDFTAKTAMYIKDNSVVVNER